MFYHNYERPLLLADADCGDEGVTFSAVIFRKAHQYRHDLLLAALGSVSVI
jgi:hypothetical protein